MKKVAIVSCWFFFVSLFAAEQKPDQEALMKKFEQGYAQCMSQAQGSSDKVDACQEKFMAYLLAVEQEKKVDKFLKEMSNREEQRIKEVNDLVDILNTQNKKLNGVIEDVNDINHDHRAADKRVDELRVGIMTTALVATIMTGIVGFFTFTGYHT